MQGSNLRLGKIPWQATAWKWCLTTLPVRQTPPTRTLNTKEPSPGPKMCGTWPMFRRILYTTFSLEEAFREPWTYAALPFRTNGCLKVSPIVVRLSLALPLIKQHVAQPHVAPRWHFNFGPHRRPPGKISIDGAKLKYAWLALWWYPHHRCLSDCTQVSSTSLSDLLSCNGVPCWQNPVPDQCSHVSSTVLYLIYSRPSIRFSSLSAPTSRKTLAWSMKHTIFWPSTRHALLPVPQMIAFLAILLLQTFSVILSLEMPTMHLLHFTVSSFA